MGKEEGYGVSTVSIESEDPWTLNASTTWGNDVVEKKSRGRSWSWTWGFRNRWSSARRTIEQVVTPALRSVEETTRPAFNATWSFFRRNTWPFIVRVFTAKKQWLALLLFLSCAVVPMVALGCFTHRAGWQPGSWPFYYTVFAPKTMGCGNYIDNNPANATVTGIDGVFTLDQTFGRLSFSAVKAIDVAWDILVGHGVQMLAWWVTYIVFSDALLRVIERHPASFRIFQRIALEGPSLLSLWTLCKELLSVKSKRTKTLFAYMFLSTSYVLCIPMFLGAMTGYDSTSIAWMDLDDSNNIVPTSAVKYSWVISGTVNSTFDKPVCKESKDYWDQQNFFDARMYQCTCQMPDGTLAPPGTFSYYQSIMEKHCIFNYQGSNGTFNQTDYGSRWYGQEKTYNCNETVTTKINDHDYDIQTLNGNTTYCYNSKAYDIPDLQGKSRCLPDTQNPSYSWGFSTMLSGIFVFLHFGWSLSIYIVWLDAQSKSTLIQGGYGMTPLRAAFAIAKAVKRKTGLGEKQLLRHDTKDLNKELYGTGKRKGTKIDYSIFVASVEEDAEDDKRVRRRRALNLDGLPSS